MKTTFSFGLTLVFCAGVTLSLAEESASSKVTESPAPLSISRVMNQAESVLQRMQRLDSELTSNDIIGPLGVRIDRISRALQGFYKESQGLLQATPSLDRVRWLQKAWQYVGRVLEVHKDSLSGREKEIEETLNDLDALDQLWNATLQGALTNPDAPQEVVVRIRQVILQIESVRGKFLKQQQKVISLQTRLLDLQTRVDDMLAASAAGRNNALDKLLERNVTPAWSFKFASISLENWLDGIRNEWNDHVRRLSGYFTWQRSVFLAHAGLLTLLIAVLYGLRHFVRCQVKQGKIPATEVRIFEHPIAMAFLLTLIAGGVLYPVPPLLLEASIGTLILIPTVVILRSLLVRQLYLVLNALVIFYLIDQIRLVLTSLPVLSRILFLVETLACVLFLAYMLVSFHREARKEKSNALGVLIRTAARCAFVLLLVALLANLLGYDHLANFLRDGTMRCAYADVILFAAFQTLKALTSIALRVPPLPNLGMVKKQGAVIVHRLTFLFKWALILLWIAYSLDVFSLCAPLVETTTAVLTAKRHLGSIEFDWANLLLLGGTIWGAFLLSRLARFVLDADVYPRLRLPGGVPYAVSTILHYAILLATFLGAAAALGIDMTKVTILVSALGVGIGFGLQNIINNFVSGLILLFERPVKVGDVIQVGDAGGVVKRIGIRASIIHTPSGSEIIVPNGTLLSERVTNWTLSDRRRALTIPVTVSREVALDRVTEVLRLAVSLHPDILKEPAPEILITNIGTTISLEVRAWTEKILEWNVVRSDIAMAINTALINEKIPVA